MFETTSEDRKILDVSSLILENSPVKFQVTRLVDELQLSTLRYLRKKVNKIQKQSIYKHVARGWGNWLMVQAEEIGWKICRLLKTIHATMFPQNFRNFLTHLFQGVVTIKNVPFYPLYQIHTVKQKSWSYSTVQGIFFQQINQSNFTKSKLVCEKAQHFIEFLFSSGAI